MHVHFTIPARIRKISYVQCKEKSVIDDDDFVWSAVKNGSQQATSPLYSWECAAHILRIA
jgi:hypothetical protein